MGASALRAASRHALTLEDVTQLTAGIAYLRAASRSDPRQIRIGCQEQQFGGASGCAPLLLGVFEQVHEGLAGDDTGVHRWRQLGVRREVALANARDAHVIGAANSTHEPHEPVR